MKISSEQVQQILSSYGVKGPSRVQKTEQAGAVQPADDAALSTASQEITKALALISRTSDVRADKVAALKARIDAGTYQVSGGDIANSVWARALADELS